MKRFRPYTGLIKAVKWPLIGGALFALLYGVASGFSLPFSIDRIFPKIFAEDPTAAPVELSTWELFAYAMWLPFVFLLRGIGNFGSTYLVTKAAVRFVERIRTDYYSKLQAVPLAFFSRSSSGDLVSRGMADANQLQVSLTLIANEGIKQPFTLIGAIAYIIWLTNKNPEMIIILGGIAIIPITVFPVRYVGKKLLHRARRLQDEIGSVTAQFGESISAAKEIRAFGLEQRESGRFSTAIHQLFRFQMKVVKYSKSLSPTIEFLSAVGIAVTLVLAAQTDMPLRAFVSLATALYMSYDPVKKLGLISNEMRRVDGLLDRIESVLNEPITITDPVKPVEAGRLEGAIDFDNVGFAYNDDLVLDNVSASIPAGTMCALVGPSGAGKSTFANLVPRFYDAQTGSVRIDGIDVKEMRVGDLRRNIALVSQDPVLFNDTIYNNLLIGNLAASRESVETAAKNAFAADFIREFPNGYETMVGERGASLSGGQRQRLALARAFLRNAPILILDEATSALDANSEEMIQRALAKLVVGKTVILIAHRFSTIRAANLILVFDKGRIVATGTHDQLYGGNDLYRRLYDHQK